MKTISGKAILVALAIVAIIAVLSLRTFAMASRQQIRTGKTFEVTIRGQTPDGFLDLKKPVPQFDNALSNLCSHGDHDITFKLNGGPPIHPYKPCHRHGSIKTDKVTKSELADSAASGASGANDPNVVQHLYSDSVNDIEAVLACFK